MTEPTNQDHIVSSTPQPCDIDTPPKRTDGFTLDFRTASPIYTPLIDLVPEDAAYADSDEGNAQRFLDIYKE